jgi:hypothetical protein
LIQVGSNCLKDFLGHKSVTAYASWAEILADLNDALGEESDEGMGGGGGGGRTSLDLVGFVEAVYGIMKSHGMAFVSKAKAREDMSGRTTATTDEALHFIYTTNKDEKREFQRIMENVTAEDKELVQSAVDWARGMKDGPEADVNGLPDYYWNLSLACSSPVVKRGTEGIVGSLMAAYQRAVLGQAQQGGAGAVGEKGQDVTLQVTIEQEKPYGDTTVYQARTQDNKLVQWSGETTALSQGQQIHIQGVVIGFTKIYAQLATRLARVKVITPEEFAAAQQAPQAAQDLGQSPEYVDGEKVTTDVTVLSIREMEMPSFGYGRGSRTTKLYKMVDRWGNTLTWFSSGEDLGLGEGEKANITATVKKHNEFKGQQEIQITRVKVNSRALPEGETDKRLNSAQMKEIKKQMKQLEDQFLELCFGYTGGESTYDRVGVQYGPKTGNYWNEMEQGTKSIFPPHFYNAALAHSVGRSDQIIATNDPAGLVDQMVAAVTEGLTGDRERNWEESVFSGRSFEIEGATREVREFESFLQNWPQILSSLQSKLTELQTKQQQQTGFVSNYGFTSILDTQLPYQIRRFIGNPGETGMGYGSRDPLRTVRERLTQSPPDQWIPMIEQEVQQAVEKWRATVQASMQAAQQKMREEHQKQRGRITQTEQELQEVSANKDQYAAKITQFIQSTPFRKIIEAEPQRAELNAKYRELEEKLGESMAATKLYGPLPEAPKTPRTRRPRQAMGIKWLKRATGEPLDLEELREIQWLIS